MTKRSFSEICREDSETPRPLVGDSIGIYKEKRLHRVLKKYITDSMTSYETPIGKYVADIFEDGHITEIQTRCLYRLLPKLRYYMDHTDFSVTVVYPIIRNKYLIRIDKDTGEILRKRMSGAHGSLWELLPELYGLWELLPNERITIKVIMLDAEEYRYSEAIRYRKEGKYDSELFPTELILERDFSDRGDFAEFLSEAAQSFGAAEYSKISGLRGRDLYSALNFLCAIGLLSREKLGNRYLYVKI